MTDPKERDKPQIRTRPPGRASRPNMLSRVQLRPAAHPIEEILAGGPSPLPDSHQTQTGPVPVPDPNQQQTLPDPDQTQTRPAPKSARTKPRPTTSAAPEKDFARVANSITREALPAGAFPGSSKKIYDALYQRTRGAVKPTKSVRATRRELMRWTNIKDVKTINAHVRKLVEAGLITRIKLSGEHEGSIYEINLPEEVEQYQTQTSTAAVPSTNQKTDSDQYQKTVWVGSGNTIENTTTYGEPKTSFKTVEKNDDDEAFAGLVEVLKRTERDIMGRESSPAEAARWRELGELLTTELKIAAARTTVSSVPAFLTEHLRRRLWKIEKRQDQPGGGESPKQTTKETSPPNVRECPDCFGTGMWYPESYEKGVARCRHDKLSAEEGK